MTIDTRVLYIVSFMNTTHLLNINTVLSPIVQHLLSVFGTVGNVLSGIVMTRKSMRSNTMALMLTVLAVVDTLVLWVDMLRQYLKKIHDIDLRTFSSTSCKLHR